MGRQPVARVLIIEQGEGLWGAQRFVLRLAPLLEQRGIEQILAAPAGSATAVAWRAAGREHVALPVPANRALRRSDGRPSAPLAAREAVRTAATAARTARIAGRLGIDVVQANSHWSHLEAVLASAACRRPALLVLHEENEPDLIGRLRGVAVWAAARTVAVSDAVAASLPGWAAGHTVVIRNGVDTDALSPGPADPGVRACLSTDPDAPLVLAMSRLDPRKGIDKVIRAVAALPDHLASTRLAVAGAPSLDPTSGTSLRRLGAELLGDRVVFLGARSDIGDLLRASDVLVLASSLEGLPLSVLEAQACGRPVVSFPTSGIPEVITDGATGLLARQDDVDDLSAGIARVLGDQTLAELLGARARASVVAHHTLAAQADSMAGTLISLAGRARRSGRAGSTARRRPTRGRPLLDVDRRPDTDTDTDREPRPGLDGHSHPGRDLHHHTSERGR
ncbi:glycosyltransferase family 4 protein [Frankia sp. Cpl3]|uniref:glycosyltransferase family 4 protein n=1 Tax=Parafrankia colletiae TaxID=573497 RepID=UPI000B0B2B53|nr:glycosyltransferase family 4 protein [Parafrankia colletiae]MCK9901042.1 glycosyltransferase family 4 protein [Frankia sp. Cpl3]